MPRTKTKTTKKATKSDYIRSLPRTMKAPEVVERGKSEGVTFSTGLVHAVRSMDKTRAKRAAKKNKKNGHRANGHSNGHSNGHARRANGHTNVYSNGFNAYDPRHEELLRAVAAEMGLSRAIGVLEQEHEKVRAVLGG